MCPPTNGPLRRSDPRSDDVLMGTARTGRAGGEADLATIMGWRRFLNEFVMDPAELEGEDWDDVREQVVSQNRRVAAESLATGFFDPGTPLDTDRELVAAFLVMKSRWGAILDALADGCRLTYVLQPFLADHGHDAAYRHHRVAALGLSLGVPSNATVLAVVSASLADARRRAEFAAREAADSAGFSGPLG